MVVSGFPRRSETFALGELLALEARGALAGIFATKPGDGCRIQPGCESLLSRVRTLPEGSPQYQAGRILENLGGERVAGVHGYFAHTPAEVAREVAALLGVPYGFSVHARDARKVTTEELAERAKSAACIVACNRDVANVFKDRASVHLLPHGIDLVRFKPRPIRRDGPLQLLAVGRLVEKKGFHILIEAAARLRSAFRLRIIGEGRERARLRALIAKHDLQDYVTLAGEATHKELPDAYRDAHVVVVPSVEDQTGDRDGLPNVVLEALACGRPVVASDISAIGSAITHGKTGLLVPPNDARALALTLDFVGNQHSLRERLGVMGRTRVEQDFEIGHCTERLNRLLARAYA